MMSSDVIISVASTTLYHSNARIAACRAGARFLSMACCKMSVLASSAMFADFEKQEALVKKVAPSHPCEKNQSKESSRDRSRFERGWKKRGRCNRNVQTSRGSNWSSRY